MNKMICITLDRDHYSKSQEIYRWCVDRCGEPYEQVNGLVWYAESRFGHQCHYFKREEDAVMFTLKWL